MLYASAAVPVISVLVAALIWNYYLAVHRNRIAENLTSLGGVSHDSVRIWFLQTSLQCKTNHTRLTIALRKRYSSDRGSPAEWSQGYNVAMTSWIELDRSCTKTVSVDGLDPSTEYEYQVLWERQGESELRHYGEFSTFPIPGSPGRFNFSFGSCLQVTFTKRALMKGLELACISPLQQILVQSPAAFPFMPLYTLPALAGGAFALLLGDSVYADDPLHRQNDYEVLSL